MSRRKQTSLASQLHNSAYVLNQFQHSKETQKAYSFVFVQVGTPFCVL